VDLKRDGCINWVGILKRSFYTTQILYNFSKNNKKNRLTIAAPTAIPAKPI